MDLDIVIVSYNTRDLLHACLRSLPAAVEDLTCTVWVVDNHSTDQTPAMVRRDFPHVRLLENPHNVGFSRANNQALRQGSARHVLLLNPDTQPEAGALAGLWRYLETHAQVGAVGPMLLNSDGSLQPNGRPFPTLWREFVGHTGLWRFWRRGFERGYEYGREDLEAECGVDQVSGACLMVPRRVLEAVGALDESFFMFYEEIEWCWRIRRGGYEVRYVPSYRVVHHWMGSVRQQSRAMTHRLLVSGVVYHWKTGGWWGGVGMVPTALVGMARNEVLHLGVGVKRALRQWKRKP